MGARRVGRDGAAEVSRGRLLLDVARQMLVADGLA